MGCSINGADGAKRQFGTRAAGAMGHSNTEAAVAMGYSSTAAAEASGCCITEAAEGVGYSSTEAAEATGCPLPLMSSFGSLRLPNSPFTSLQGAPHVLGGHHRGPRRRGIG